MEGRHLERYTFEDDGRIYTDHGDLWLPSVSTVLGVREKAPALKQYLKNTSQAKQDEKQFYTSNRGTLIHYNALDQLADEEMWSDDEQSSEDELRGIAENDETGLTGDQETWDRFQRDNEWAMNAWSLIRRVYGINPENVLDVELFVLNTDVGYAGQFDLLYVDEDTGEVVLADIKTSKRVYDKHLIQLAAYSKAVNIAVDRMEVIRMNPDGETWEVSSSEEWQESRADLWAEFVSLREQLQDETLDALKERAQDAQHA